MQLLSPRISPLTRPARVGFAHNGKLGNEIVVCTTNAGKQGIFKSFGLDGRIQNVPVNYATKERLSSLKEPEETQDTILGNAIEKAEAYHAHFKALGQNISVIAEDFGIHHKDRPELQQYGGVHSKRWLTPKLYTLLFPNELDLSPKDVTDYHRNRAMLELYNRDDQAHAKRGRRIDIESAFVLITPDGTKYVGQGIEEAEIISNPDVIQRALERSQKAGFGFEYIMHPVIYGRVQDGLKKDTSPAEATRTHARAKAIQQLKTAIASH